MRYVLSGSLAFIFLYFFDVFTLNNQGTKKKIFGIFGMSLLIFSGIMAAVTSERIAVPDSVRFMAWILFSVSLVLLVYSLFIELPFGKTYGRNKHSNMLVDTGTYALCRHPGVLWFGLVFFFFFFATGSTLIIISGIVWTALDVLHVYLQEKMFFPKMFPEYATYVKTTPMLIPSRKSIRKCFSTLF